MDTFIKKRLLVLITNPYASLNFIHSGLLQQLSKDFDIHLASDFMGHDDINAINRHFHIQISSSNITFPEESILDHYLRQFEKALFYHFFKIETERIKNLEISLFLRLLKQVFLYTLSIFNLNQWLLIQLRDILTTRMKKLKNLQSLEYKLFEGVISTSPFDPRENRITNTFQKIGVPTMGIIISWDNLTTKGVINSNFNKILVWNRYMIEEYHRLYNIFKIKYQEVVMVGNPRFDIYHKSETSSKPTISIKNQYNIPNHHKVILFATSSPKHYPCHHLILQHLLLYISNKDITIILRQHPTDRFDYLHKFPNELNLRIDRSQFLFPDKSTIPNFDFLEGLNALIKSCNVCIQVASTIRLEAAICIKPVISIAYNESNARDNRHVKNLYKYAHQIPINKLEIDHMVFSKKELFDRLDKVLAAPDPKNRIEDFIQFQDATTKTLEQIRSWLR